jgi:light-regulated signal transduction histidine kinase (bacteriophytochrome)
LQAAVQEVGGGVTHYPLPTVTVDSVQLGWVFQNLIGDVLRVHGGSLAASSCLGYAEGKAASFLSVEDNGMAWSRDAPSGSSPAFSFRTATRSILAPSSAWQSAQ